MAFKFGNGIVKIQIEDNIFRVVLSQELHDKIIRGSKKIEELRRKNEELSDDKKEQAVTAGFDEIIDDLLGAGSSEKIFAGREPDAFERVAVFTYICTEITSHCYGIGKKKKTDEHEQTV